MPASRSGRVLGGTLSLFAGLLFTLQGSIVLAFNGGSAEGVAGAVLAFGAATGIVVMQVRASPSNPLARAAVAVGLLIAYVGVFVYLW
mgnify:CR=1 FL=1